MIDYKMDFTTFITKNNLLKILNELPEEAIYLSNMSPCLIHVLNQNNKLIGLIDISSERYLKINN